MTIALSYLDDLSRVRVTLSSIAEDAVRVERSANELLWETVRGGRELPVDSGDAQLDDYTFYADAETFYRVLDPADDSVIEQDSITVSLDGQVWLKSVRHPAANTVVRVADYGDVQHPARSSVFEVDGRALPTGVAELHGGRNHDLVLRTSSQAEEDHLKMMVRTGDVFFVHVPTAAAGSRAGNVLLPGSMHVLIGQPTIHRVGGVSSHHLLTLPLIEVTAPGVDVVGTTLTVQGLVNLHGSISSVWAAYPTIRDLWDTIGSLDDLVVI